MRLACQLSTLQYYSIQSGVISIGCINSSTLQCHNIHTGVKIIDCLNSKTPLYDIYYKGVRRPICHFLLQDASFRSHVYTKVPIFARKFVYKKILVLTVYFYPYSMIKSHLHIATFNFFSFYLHKFINQMRQFISVGKISITIYAYAIMGTHMQA